VDIDALLLTYPRSRPPLPPAYEQIYRREYLLNRKGGTRATRLAARAEAWMHTTIASRSLPGTVLEIGAGTLNHLPFEPNAARYDVVEPFDAFYRDSPSLARIGTLFRQIEHVPERNRYDRIVSVAVLEHLQDLPFVVARSSLLLAENGVAQHAIPSEGGALWGLGWRLTTGLAYRIRNGLSYAVAMRHEHINDASEIIEVLRWFYPSVIVRRFPLPFHHASLYTYIEAKAPRRDRCRAYLASRATSGSRAAGEASRAEA
jgi:Methyltransferase domain